MRIQDPKLCNMAHAMSLSVFIALKGTNFYIFIDYMVGANICTIVCILEHGCINASDKTLIS